MTPKQIIDAFVEEERKNATCSSNGGQCGEDATEAAVRRAIKYGLELARECGPEEKKDVWGNGLTMGYNLALTAKNAAIDDLMKEVDLPKGE